MRCACPSLSGRKDLMDRLDLGRGDRDLAGEALRRTRRSSCCSATVSRSFGGVSNACVQTRIFRMDHTPNRLQVPLTTIHVPGSREFPFTLDFRQPPGM